MLEPLGLPFTALYALAAGHAVLPVLDGDPTAGAAARAALAVGERWLAGDPVSAETLTNLLMDENEEGLLLLEQQCTDPRLRLAWLAVQTAVAYVAWQAWRAEGRFPAALVSEVDEDTLELLTTQAIEAGVPPEALGTVRHRIESTAPAVPVLSDLLSLLP